MPVTQLDPKAALIVIDLQKGITSQPLAHTGDEIVARAAALAHAFRASGLPVILVNVTAAPPGRTDAGARNFAFPPDWADLVPELDAQPTDHLISKRSPGAFLTTNLDKILRDRNVTQVFVAGISTSVGVQATVFSAFDLGYHVVVVTDACTDRELSAHTYAIENVFPKRSETATTNDVLKLLGSEILP